jgi:mRNA-degrading endonuclease RelE of RelBE toxin-antitoxin system
MKFVFFETPIFSRLLPTYLDDDGYKDLQSVLLRSPEAGDVMPGTGGFRKLRSEDPRRGKGKRGGLRIIYYYLTADRQIWFFTIYGKDEAADLSHEQKKALKKAIKAELAFRGKSDDRKA